MSLPVKKIYIDSQYTTTDSESGSKFKIEPPYAVTMPQNTIFTIDEVCIPHSWYSTEKDIHDKLYIHVLDTGNRARYSIIVQIPTNHYNGATLQAAMQNAIADVLAGSGCV